LPDVSLHPKKKNPRFVVTHPNPNCAFARNPPARTSVTDPPALWLFGARVVQSLIHLASLSAIAVMLRFTAFAVQLIISVYWAWKLLA